jgi:TIR domain
MCMARRIDLWLAAGKHRGPSPGPSSEVMSKAAASSDRANGVESRQLQEQGTSISLCSSMGCALRLFLSYKFADQSFVELVYYCLSKQGIDLFNWPLQGRAGYLSEELSRPIDDCDGMIAFIGAEWSGKQKQEVDYFLETRKSRPLVPVQLFAEIPSDGKFAVAGLCVNAALGNDYEAALLLSQKIVVQLGLTWVPEDGLPNSYIVDYEKEFLEKFHRGDDELLRRLRSECGWTKWPSIVKEAADLPNPITDNSIGTLWGGPLG